MTNVFLWGSSGTGKTLLAMETLKIKLSRLRAERKEQKKIRVIVTEYSDRVDSSLLANIREKHLANVEGVQILCLDKLCEALKIKYNWKHPKAVINEVLRSLSSDQSQVTIFVCDELLACWRDGQTSSDWTDVATPDNVVYILSVRPIGGSEITNLTPPSNSELVVERKLIQGHRNCPEIRSVV